MTGQREIIIGTAGGFTYLFPYGVVWLAVALASFALPLRSVALVYLALPVLALSGQWLLRHVMGRMPLSAANPLRPVVYGLWAIPVLIGPALALLLPSAAAQVPALCAAVFGAHLLPLGAVLRSRVTMLAGFVLAPGAVALDALSARGGLHVAGVATGALLITVAFIASGEAARYPTRAGD